MFRASRLAVLVLCCLWLSLSACAATNTQVPTMTPTQPMLTATPTLTSDVAFQNELAVAPNLRGHFIGGPGGEIEALAAVTIVHVNVQLAAPSLADVQWDAFVIQQALWTGHEFTIPEGWEVSVQFFLPNTDPNASPFGREIGVANLHTASERQFNWDHLSPQQAWARYDGVEYSATGL